MHKAFSAATNLLTAQPNGAGEKLIFRSDNAADTGNFTATGLVAASPDTETKALAGKREVQTAALFQSLTSALLSAAQTGIVRVYGQGVAAVGDLTVNSLPANNDNLKAGLTGFEQTYLFKTALTGAANEILIAGSVAAQATNILEALTAGANAGTDYGTGTTANAYLLASAPTGAVMPFADRLAIARQLAWNVSQTVGATLAIRQPIGGVTGTLLATIAIGATQLNVAFNLATEDLAVKTLPGKVKPTTDWIAIGGKECTLRLKCENVASGIAVKYQTSTDKTNVDDGATAITNLDNNVQFIVPAEKNIENIRLVFTANTNVDAALDARVIFPNV